MSFLDRSGALFSSRSEEWGTPKALYDALDREFQFTLDPAATAENFKCAKYFTKEQDGLQQDWSKERVFLNPPYGSGIGKWMQKIATADCEIAVALVHARCDTKWWHSWVEPYADEIRFVKGRIKFEGGKYSSTFPSVIVIYRNGQTRRRWGQSIGANNA